MFVVRSSQGMIVCKQICKWKNVQHSRDTQPLETLHPNLMRDHTLEEEVSPIFILKATQVTLWISMFILCRLHFVSKRSTPQKSPSRRQGQPVPYMRLWDVLVKIEQAIVSFLSREFRFNEDLFNKENSSSKISRSNVG